MYSSQPRGSRCYSSGSVTRWLRSDDDNGPGVRGHGGGYRHARFARGRRGLAAGGGLAAGRGGPEQLRAQRPDPAAERGPGHAGGPGREPGGGRRRRPAGPGGGPGGTIELASAARASYPSVVAALAVAIAHAAYSGAWPPGNE